MISKASEYNIANNIPKSKGRNLRYLILCDNSMMSMNANNCVMIMAITGKETFISYYDEYWRRYTLRVYQNIVYRVKDCCDCDYDYE